MADTKGSLLPAGAALAGSDRFIGVQGGVAVGLTADQIGTYYKTRNAVNNASVAAQGPGFATDTYIVGSSCAIPTTSGLGSLQAKTQYRLKFSVSKTAAGTVAPIIQLRVGTAASTADTSRCTLTLPAQTAVIDEGLIEVFATFRTVGSGTSAVIVGVATLVHRLAATGLSTGGGPMVTATGGGFDSTAANLVLGASVNAGTSAAWTMQLVQAELYNLA